MMRVAALYDIHGNLPALEAVLEEVRAASVAEIVVGGDVYPGPLAAEALALLLALDLPVRFIRGNGDREVLAMAEGRETGTVPEQHRAGLRWNAERLDPEHRRAMEAWPATLRRAIPDLGEVLFCHATPRNDLDIFTRETPAAPLVEIFASAEAPLVICGHTHMQFDRRIGGVRVVNAGSVGMAFGEPGAYWLLLGDGVEPRRTRYDRARAAERLGASGYPAAVEFAARSVLSPPSEEEMIALFSGVELGKSRS